MKYKGFNVIVFVSTKVQKFDYDSKKYLTYNGFNCFIYSNYDENCYTPLDCFDLAIGIDIKEKKYFWVEDYIKNYIDDKFDELKQLEKEYFLNKHN